MSTTLTAPETREFAKLELVIESGLDSFVRVGSALAKIRDAELYRANHATFDAYCRDRWKIAKSRAYQLIAAATTVDAMYTMVDELPTNERQVRPLAKLPEAERADAWQAAVDAEPSGPTAETVEAVVAGRLGEQADDMAREVAQAGRGRTTGEILADLNTIGSCPKGGDHKWVRDTIARETYCERCLEPIAVEQGSEVISPVRHATTKSTVITRCEQFWSTLNDTERIIAAGWFSEQL